MSDHISGTIKALAVTAAAIFTYINAHYTPLFYVMVALFAIDLLYNAHQPGKQMEKFISAAVGFGIPTFLIQHLNDPQLLKWSVLLITLVEAQIVFPSILSTLRSFKFSSNKVQNAAAQTSSEALVQAVYARIKKEAEANLTSASAPTVAPPPIVTVTVPTRPEPTAGDPTVK